MIKRTYAIRFIAIEDLFLLNQQRYTERESSIYGFTSKMAAEAGVVLEARRLGFSPGLPL